MWLLGTYFVLFIGVADVLNVRMGVEVLTLCVVVAAVFITRRVGAFARDWWFLLVGLVMWNLSGPIAAFSPFPLHLDFMYNFDRLLFMGHEPVAIVQSQLWTGTVGWLDIVTSVAYNMHLAEPYVFGYLLWRLDRALYFQFAAAVLSLLVVGFLIFILFPAIPPWLAAKSYGKVPGVVNLFGVTLRQHPLPFHGGPIFQIFGLRGDRVAAFPSEHSAFPVLELLFFSRLRGWLALPFLGWIALILFSVVYLGEHWVTDVLAGWLLALVIFAFVRWTAGRPAATP